MKNCRRGMLPALGLHAETRSLFPLPEARLGGMGGPHFRLTWFAGEASMLGGGPAYLIVDRRLYLGLNGSYLEGNTDEFMIGYGGPSAGGLRRSVRAGAGGHRPGRSRPLLPPGTGGLLTLDATLRGGPGLRRARTERPLGRRAPGLRGVPAGAPGGRRGCRRHVFA
jgi:hypothetical protein